MSQDFEQPATIKRSSSRLDSGDSNTLSVSPNRGRDGPLAPEKEGPLKSLTREGSFKDWEESQFGEDLSPNFFQELLVDDEEARSFHIAQMIESLESSDSLLSAHLGTVIRFAFESPFEDIRIKFYQFLERLKQQGKEIPIVSLRCAQFISHDLAPTVTSSEESVLGMYQSIFLQTGRLSHLDRIIAFHPTYLEVAFQTYSTLIRGKGPLSQPWRIYIGIISAARCDCDYLVRLLEQDFLLADGNSEWLKGSNFAPQKLKNFFEVNAILTHQPWTITPANVARLLKPEQNLDAWSLAELIQALSIAATIRAMSKVVLGVGVLPELDIGDHRALQDRLASSSHVLESPPPEPVDQFDEETQKIKEMLETRSMDEELAELSIRLEQFNQIGEIEDDSAQRSRPPKSPSVAALNLDRYNEYSSLKHVDFESRNKLLHAQDFSWEEQCFELINRYLPQLAVQIDDQFSHIKNLTYNKFNRSDNIDTTPFRSAIWNYVHRVKGVFHDDYSYAQVNQFLSRNAKIYIKKVSCLPSSVTREDFNNIGVNLMPSEKVHIALLSAESSKQAELMWVFMAITQYQNQ